MYQLVVMLKDLNNPGAPLIHEVRSPHFASIQEAFESWDGKEAFQVWLDINEQIEKELDRICESEPTHA